MYLVLKYYCQTESGEKNSDIRELILSRSCDEVTGEAAKLIACSVSLVL